MDDNPIKPVAYDVDGKPLYASPESADQAAKARETTERATAESGGESRKPQIVYMSRSLDPDEVEIPPEIKGKHDKSVERYPWLNISEHEYIVSAVQRHRIGLIVPAVFTAVSAAVIFTLMFNYPFVAEGLGLSVSYAGLVVLIGMLLTILLLIAGYAAIWVFMNNRFFLTNESVIQEIQQGLFNHREQTVSLMNIEDASYTQHGPIQTMLNYGTIRLSTEGEETTYEFDYVANPKDHIAILNNAIEAFKNGRPVGNEELSGVVDTTVEEKF